MVSNAIWSPLALAAINGNLDDVKKILESAGSNKNKLLLDVHNGRTAYEWALTFQTFINMESGKRCFANTTPVGNSCVSELIIESLKLHYDTEQHHFPKI